MVSIIPGYEYDIFISYRQKDNKHDGWVTEFVDNLKGELESTFKEEISVYFDINPHDGLLETHDVDASLKEKLKCLVFIPIISRTYCDPKSFAWEHEFKAFIEEASKDQYGLKVKLLKGNVASRVLPVLIHDLDIADIKLCESVLGGVLRGIEFIYKELGFNRPLKPDDDEKINLNKTKYRNQITKVTLAIKEIILGLQTERVVTVKESAKRIESFEEVVKNEKHIDKEKSVRFNKNRLLAVAAFLALLIIAGILAYPKIFNRDKLANLRSSDGRISVAVMPFQNLTNDTIWNVWEYVIQANLITSLANSEALCVRQSETINSLLKSRGIAQYASILPSVATNLSQKLDANILVNGSITQAGSTLRIIAQIIDTQTKETINTFQLDGNSKNVLYIIDSLSVIIRNALAINNLGKNMTPVWRHTFSTNSPQAYQYFILGDYAFLNGDYQTAIEQFSKALKCDSNLILAARKMSVCYWNLHEYDEAKKTCLRIYRKKDQLPLIEQIWADWLHAVLFETPVEQIKYLKQIISFDDKMISGYQLLGFTYLMTYQYDKAIPQLQKALELYEEWDSKPLSSDNYSDLALVYYKNGQYQKAKRMLQKEKKYFPEDESSENINIWLSIKDGDTARAKQYIDKVTATYKENLYSEELILLSFAFMFSFAEITDKAEEYSRKLLLLEPYNMYAKKDLAYLLIDHNINVNEGIELIDSALKSMGQGRYRYRDDYLFLDTKGWGLYKQGKYKEALELLEKSDSLKPIYNHDLYLHIEEVKKAIANQK
jgi:tetratricopeptide (TPR) repeat protein